MDRKMAAVRASRRDAQAALDRDIPRDLDCEDREGIISTGFFGNLLFEVWRIFNGSSVRDE